MKFIITGSGGCIAIPKPLCQCEVCVEARVKGYPYARCGCSLYCEDISLLIDTPEDISTALNNAGIKSVDAIVYSHWDPDHTAGMRVMEQLRLDWLDYHDGLTPEKPVVIYANSDVMRDINGIGSRLGSYLDYYASLHLITRKATDVIASDTIKITLIPVPIEKAVSVFVFESNGKKLVYAPCDCKPFPNEELIYGADILIIGNTIVGNTLRNGRAIANNHPLKLELYAMEDVLEMKEKYAFGRVIITHLEETWGKSYDDYINLEKKYNNINFAHDGMIITL
jgi:Metal-dependent hydrolases of the beta-lactamase superfamily I